MKKSIKCLGMVLATLMLCISAPVYAQVDKDESEVISIQVEELDNGYIIETVVTETYTNTRASSKTGTKTVNYKNGNTTLWSVSVRGNFTYNGTTSSCTSSMVIASSYDSNWKVSNTSASKSGNTAIARATGKRYAMGIVVQTIDREVRLTCSKTGVLS